MKKIISNGGSCGKLMLIIGLILSVPILIIPFYPDELQYISAFAIPALYLGLLGIIVCMLTKKEDGTSDRHLSMQTGSLTVLFAWGFGILMGSLPFILGGQLTAVRALFESVSGWTTTGLSVMDVSKAPKIYLFHRSFMQFCGGLGFVMMMVMLISEKQSMNLFNAEGHTDKLAPNLKNTAQKIFFMYSGFLGIGTAAYAVAGMDFFESVCHAMCALSTGGFSTRLGSIGEYNSLAVEIITIVLMLIGTTNFAVLFLITKRKWRQALRVSEVRFMAGLLILLVPITAFLLSDAFGMGLWESIRYSAFNIVSALSTSGFSTMDYTGFPPAAVGIMILVMLCGGGIGSTAGGLKLTRVYLMLRYAVSNIRKRIFPQRKVEVSYYTKAQGKETIDAALVNDTTGFVVCYFLIFIIGSLLITVTADCGLCEGMFEFASLLGTVGLSIGLTGT